MSIKTSTRKVARTVHKKPAIRMLEATSSWASPEGAAALERQRRSFRRHNAAEIRRVGSVMARLRDYRVFADLDPLRYRFDCEETPAIVRDKILESVVERLDGYRRVMVLKRERAKLQGQIESARDSHRKAAKALRKAQPARAAIDTEITEAYARMAESMNGDHPGLVTADEAMQDLTLDLLAIFSHTTDLTRDQILKKILPGMLAAARSSYPDCAPPRGDKNPREKYKRLRKPGGLTSDALLLHRRVLLFAGDARFSKSLFDPHRTIRTVAAPSRH